MSVLKQDFFQGLGGPCELTVHAPDQAQARQWLDMAQAEVMRIEAKYSRYRQDSVIGRINAKAGRAWVDCDEELDGLLDIAANWHAQSEGLFDITSGVLRKAWNFRDPNSPIPSQSTLDTLLPLVGWEGVERRRGAVRLARPGMEIDLGGMGKEYAVDRVAQAWVEAGVSNGIVNLGGDIRVVGDHPEGRPWSMGVRDPYRPTSLLATVPLSGVAMTTSGNYERYVRDPRSGSGGTRLGHILNPRTGYPVTGWNSVTVIAPTAQQAGFVSTLAMLREGLGLQTLRQAGLPFLAVDDDNVIHQRAG